MNRTPTAENPSPNKTANDHINILMEQLHEERIALLHDMDTLHDMQQRLAERQRRLHALEVIAYNTLHGTTKPTE